MDFSYISAPTRVVSLNLWKAVVYAALVAAGVNSLIYLGGTRLGLIPADFIYKRNGELAVIGLREVAFATVMTIIVAGIIYWLLGFTRKPALIFTGMVIAAFLITLFPVFELSQASVNYKLALGLMHLVGAVTTWYFFIKDATQPRF